MNKVNFVKIVDSKSATNIHVLADNALTEKHVFMAETCTVKHGGYVVVDFGKEICGRVHVVFGYNECEGKVRIRLGESVAEACAELGSVEKIPKLEGRSMIMFLAPKALKPTRE